MNSLDANIRNNKTKGELNSQSMDFTKLNKYFGWKPKHKFEEESPLNRYRAIINPQ